MAWILSKHVITAPIIGVSRPAHLDDAIAALDIKLSIEEITELEMAYVPHQAVGFE